MIRKHVILSFSFYLIPSLYGFKIYRVYNLLVAVLNFYSSCFHFQLQQFRQKKDNKGGSSHAKSSKKAGKPQLPDSDSDAASSASISTVTSQITDGNVEADSHSNMVNTESSESQSVANSLAHNNIDPSVDSSSVVTTYDTGNETVLDSNAEVAHQVHGVRENDSELSAQDQGEIAQDIGADVLEGVSLRTSDSQVSEGGATNDHASVPVAVLPSLASVTTAVGESVTDERKCQKREELLLLSEDIPNTSVMQTSEDQVTDLGCALSLSLSPYTHLQFNIILYLYV